MRSVSERMTPDTINNTFFERMKLKLSRFIHVQKHIDPIEDIVTYRAILKLPKELQE